MDGLLIVILCGGLHGTNHDSDILVVDKEPIATDVIQTKILN